MSPPTDPKIRKGTVLGKPSRTHPPNQQKQHTSSLEVAPQQQKKRARNSPERNPYRDNSNGSGKPHQNTGQPSDAPQPRGQRNSNQKRAQHSSGETSLPPEPIEKDSGSTSPELTTSQHQADNNHRQVSQCSTSDATRHTEHLLSSSNNADQA
ncbi:hypothetical protein Taro_015776 [Colocasia esculenta]|uniref:Uncharacterized protein n=1 Tax=Colocasia esculenta TaxID=4460 RepID=A0A843UIT1_COLES|nr:hypothetical protein [Colocasia esculenta]